MDWAALRRTGDSFAPLRWRQDESGRASLQGCRDWHETIMAGPTGLAKMTRPGRWSLPPPPFVRNVASAHQSSAGGQLRVEQVARLGLRGEAPDDG